MNVAATILIVEDDDRLAGLLLEYLSKHSFEMTWVRTGEAAGLRP